jgi:hypothetical protein
MGTNFQRVTLGLFIVAGSIFEETVIDPPSSVGWRQGDLLVLSKSVEDWRGI